MTESESSVASRWRDRVRGREALISFYALEIVALPLLLFFGRHAWFTQDDWDFLSARTVGNFDDWIRPHFQHLTLLPMLAYRLFWVIFGLHTYVPYLALAVGAHLVTAALLRAVMSHAGVHPWLATALAGAFVFFGAGGENILVAFQITFVGALAFGLAQMLLSDHDGPIDHRDWLGLLAGLTGLLCSGVALAMTIVVGLTVLFRRGRRGIGVALFHTVPIALVYALWMLVAPEGQATTNLRSHSVVQVTKFVLVGISNAFGGLGQFPGIGVAIGAVLVVGLVLAFREKGRVALRNGYGAPMALLVGAVIFLFITGSARAGQGGLVGLLKSSGPERARESRYTYLIAAMALPAIALAADALMRRKRWLIIPVLVILLIGVPTNVHELATYSPRYATPAGQRYGILSLPRLPLASQMRGTRTPWPDTRLRGEGLTFGWLVDSVDRIPDPGPIEPRRAATETLQFMLLTATPGPNLQCVPLAKPKIIVVDKGGSFTIERDDAALQYLPPHNLPSFPVGFNAGTYTALGGPLRLRIAPLAKGVELCR